MNFRCPAGEAPMNTHLALLLLLLAWSLNLFAQPVDLPQEYGGAIGSSAWLMQEADAPMQLVEAQQAYANGDFLPSTRAYLNFGIGARPRWLRIEMNNPTRHDLLRRLSIETAWLDHVELYFLRNNTVQAEYRLGDALPFSQRPIEQRYFVVEERLSPGTTTLYMRVVSADPMVLPIYLSSVEQMHARQQIDAYSYGLLYGVLAALLLYNLVLYLGIRSSRYLFYAIYLLLFILMNLAYTGHGFQWLWPSSPNWQQWSNPVLMIAYGLSGLLFATRFLDTQECCPRSHRLMMWIGASVVLAMAICILAAWQVLALYLAFAFILLFSVLMILLGVTALRAGNPVAPYFLYAAIASALGAALTALTVWGWLPYTVLGYRAVDMGTVIEAVLLALALAEQFRRNQDQRVRAEQMARIDPLTSLHNRRAFAEMVEPLWYTGLRKFRPMSLILLDLDDFKLINDQHGHAQGDQVLVETARELTKCARAGDVLSRWGGEEFILFMPETRLDEAVIVAERMRERLAELWIEVDDQGINFSASFGVAQYRQDMHGLEGLIREADQRLYEAKAGGRNQVRASLG